MQLPFRPATYTFTDARIGHIPASTEERSKLLSLRCQRFLVEIAALQPGKTERFLLHADVIERDLIGVEEGDEHPQVVGNPTLKKNQRQRRLLPAHYGPTSKASYEAKKIRAKEQRALKNAKKPLN